MTDPLRARLTGLLAEMDAVLVPYWPNDVRTQRVKRWRDELAALLREPPIGLSENVMVGPREPPAAAPLDDFDRAVNAVVGPACIACGERGDGGYEVDNGPGPFCSDCWGRLEEYFTARAAAPEGT